MKSITIAGNIGKDAVTRQTQNGDSVTSFGVGVEERSGQNKRTIWFDCSLWGKRGEALWRYLTKGSKVAVSGDLSTREHDGKTYLTVRANEVTLMGGGQSDNRSDTARTADQAQRPAGNDQRHAAYDDEIPF